MRWRASHGPSASLPRIHVLLPVSACLLALAWIGCAPSDQQSADPAAAQFAELRQTHDALAAVRAEIHEVQAQLASAGDEAAADAAPEGEGAGEEGETGASAEELQGKLDGLRSQASTQGEDFYQKVVEYLNSSGIVEGQALTADQRQAFDWKAEEDIRIAQEYIDKGGDYSRAIDIYNGSLMADPENQALLDAKAEAERLQYMDEERFAQVEKGMTQAQVQALLGTVNARNVRDYEDDNTVGWFYRREDGGAAGVFFKERKGEWVVAVVDYNAAKPPSAAGEEATDE